MQSTPQQVTGRPHRRRIDVGLRQQAAPQQNGDFVGVELIVLGLTAVDGFHRQGVSQHERDPLRGADVREPIPREHALGRDDQILAVRGDDLEECLSRRVHIARHEDLAGRVKDAAVHRFHVEIDSAIVPMLPVVESHSALLLRGYARVPALSLPSWEVQGEG